MAQACVLCLVLLLGSRALHVIQVAEVTSSTWKMAPNYCD